ncbi:MAG: hypothetical protein KatS3mg061_2947 [Dehalococcoidia bacterium]|nr:MAG: hypothetical protein KatS3mg061_2947 [Dehalococcoidia bacterium]
MHQADGRLRRVLLAHAGPPEPRVLLDDGALLDEPAAAAVSPVLRDPHPILSFPLEEPLSALWTTERFAVGPLSAALCVPLVVRGSAIGLLTVAGPRRYDLTDLRLLESFASFAAAALDNASLVRALRQALAEQAASAVHLETLLRAAPVGLLVCNPDLTLARVNDRAVELVGWGAAPGQPIGALEGGLGSHLEDRARRVFASGEAIPEFELVVPAGARRRSFRLSLYPLWQGSEVRQVGVVIVDNTAQREAEESLRYRLEFEELLASLSTHFINLPTPAIDAGILETIRALGEFLDVDRLSVVLFHPERDLAEPRYRWDAQVPPAEEPAPPATIPLAALSWSFSRLRALEPVMVSHLSEIPDTTEREYWAGEGTASLLAVPLIVRGQAEGAVVVNAVGREISWSSLDLAFLRLASILIVSALERKRSDQLERESERLVGATLAAREMSHLLTNDITAAVGAFELLLDDPARFEEYQPLLRGALENLLRAG